MSQYGFVFGVAHLSAMLASPFFASWTSRLGPRRVFLLGTAFQFLGGGILFGLLEHVRDPNTFLWMSYVLRFSHVNLDVGKDVVVLHIVVVVVAAAVAAVAVAAAAVVAVVAVVVSVALVLVVAAAAAAPVVQFLPLSQVPVRVGRRCLLLRRPWRHHEPVSIQGCHPAGVVRDNVRGRIHNRQIRAHPVREEEKSFETFFREYCFRCQVPPLAPSCTCPAASSSPSSFPEPWDS